MSQAVNRALTHVAFFSWALVSPCVTRDLAVSELWLWQLVLEMRVSADGFASWASKEGEITGSDTDDLLSLPRRLSKVLRWPTVRDQR